MSDLFTLLELDHRVVERLLSQLGEAEEGEIFPTLRNKLDRGVQDNLVTKLMEAKAAAGLPDIDLDGATKEQLLEVARAAGVDGRTQMTKDELRKAVMSRR